MLIGWHLKEGQRSVSQSASVAITPFRDSRVRVRQLSTMRVGFVWLLVDSKIASSIPSLSSSWDEKNKQKCNGNTERPEKWGGRFHVFFNSLGFMEMDFQLCKRVFRSRDNPCRNGGRWSSLERRLTNLPQLQACR